MPVCPAGPRDFPGAGVMPLDTPIRPWEPPRRRPFAPVFSPWFGYRPGLPARLGDHARAHPVPVSYLVDHKQEGELERVQGAKPGAQNKLLGLMDLVAAVNSAMVMLAMRNVASGSAKAVSRYSANADSRCL